jgi:hypothetical protein
MMTATATNFEQKKEQTKLLWTGLQTSGELQDKTSFIDPSTGVGLLEGYSPNYLLL